MEGLLTTLNELVPMEQEEEGTKLIDLYKAGELKIGDYVNYNPIAKGETGAEAKYTYTSLGTQTGMTDCFEAGDDDGLNRAETENQVYKVNTNTKWRILGTEGEGADEHLLLISADPVAKENTDGIKYFFMYGAKGYLNCIEELNNIGKIYGYGAGAQGARSVNINDINKIAGVTVDEEEYTITPDGIDAIGQYGNSYSYNDQYTPEHWQGEDSKPETVAGRSTAYAYLGNSAGLQTNETTNPETGARLYEMIFADTGSGSSNIKPYWLASRGVGDNSSYAVFGPGIVYVGSAGSVGGYNLFFSYGYENNFYAGVRPVVSLKSSVTDSTIQKIEDQERETWTMPSL